MMSITDGVLALVRAMAPEQPSEPSLNSTLVGELGYTSLRLMELSIAVERAFALPPLSQESLAGIATVGDLVRLVQTQQDRT